MIATFWKKVLMDLWSSKARSLLVTLSIAAGIFAVGLVATSYFIVKNDMSVDYLSVNPHTAMIFAENFDDSLVFELAKTPGIDSIEARYNLWAKATSASGKLYPINLNSIHSISDTRVNRLVFEDGSQNLNDHEIYLERQGAAGLGLKIGGSVDLVLKNGEVRTLKIAGTVHDVYANPFTFTSQTSGYVTNATMEWLGESSLYNFVAITTSGSHTDKALIQSIAEKAAGTIRQSGRQVLTVSVTNPGQHPAQSIINTVLVLMAALGVMTVLLSGFLVTNTISALMGQQIRQIGVMKALGASSGQMMGMYLSLVMAFGGIALLIAMPLAAIASYGLTRWLDGMLNANPTNFFIHPLSLVLQIFIGLAVPVVSALVPVIASARLTVRQAISNYGLSSNAKPGFFDRLTESLRGLPRPLLLSLRNAFRRKSRLALTLVTLTLGGAIFISVINVREALYVELDQTYGYFQSDVNADFSTSYDVDKLQKAARDVPGIVSSEGWWTGRVNVIKTDGINDDSVLLYAPPAKTSLINPVLTAGRWLQPSDEFAVVVDNTFIEQRPDVEVGSLLQFRINKQEYLFTVVGIFRMAGNSNIGTTYMNLETLAKVTGQAGQVNSLRFLTDRHDGTRQNEVLSALQSNFKLMGIIPTLQTGSEIIAQKHSQVDLLITLLAMMAILITVVGGLGLMGTMGMNILERTREIGVMRSIGAENGAIFQMVVVEGLLIGIISWFLSLIAAVPFTMGLGKALGSLLMKVPLPFTFSIQSPALWLGLVLVFSTIACFLPARNATRLTVRDVLAYE